jgi:hypothetical protein
VSAIFAGSMAAAEAARVPNASAEMTIPAAKVLIIENAPMFRHCQCTGAK